MSAPVKSSVLESQQAAADLFSNFSEGMQHLLRSKELSDEDQISCQRTMDVVDGVAKRYMETGQQLSELEQQRYETSLDHLRHTVEFLLPLKEKEMHLAAEDLTNLREAAQFLRINFGNHESSLAIVPFNRRVVHLKSQHPQFIDREGLLDDIAKAFSEQPLLVLHGPPGVGKSEAAIAFGNQHLSEHPLVWTIQAETKDQIEQSYRELAEALYLPILVGDSFEDIEKRVLRKLENIDVPWLLVYDNLEESVNFPQRGGKILITTNFADRFSLYNKIEISCLKKREAITLLKKITEEEESSEMEELVDRLGCYPLVIAQTANYIRMTPSVTIRSFLDSMEKVDYSRMLPNERYRATLQEMFNQLLPKLPDRAREWLSVCAHLNPEKIPPSYLEVWLETHHSLSKEESKREAEKFLSLLVNRGWLRLDTSTQTFSIHRLFQELLNKEEFYFQAAQLLVEIGKTIDLEFVLKWKETLFLADQWAFHLSPLLSSAVFETLESAPRAHLLLKYGKFQQLRGKFHAAKENLEKAQAIFESLGRSHLEGVATCLTTLGSCLSFEEPSQALEKFKSALQIYDKCGPSASDQRAWCLKEMGNALTFTANIDEAKEKYRSAKELSSLLAIQTACNFNFGNIAFLENRYSEAKKKYEEVLKTWREILDPRHPNIAKALGNIGSCLRYENAFAAALEKLEEAAEIYQETLGPNHPESLNLLFQLGVILLDQGKNTESLSKFQKFLKLCNTQDIKEQKRVRIAKALHNIGCCLRNKKSFAAALEKFEEAVEIYQETLGPNHPESLAPLIEIGATLFDQGKYDESLSKCQELLELYRTNDIKDPRNSTNTLARMGDCYRKKGDAAKAHECYQKAYESAKTFFGEDDATTKKLEKFAKNTIPKSSEPDCRIV